LEGGDRGLFADTVVVKGKFVLVFN